MLAVRIRSKLVARRSISLALNESTRDPARRAINADPAAPARATNSQSRRFIRPLSRDTPAKLCSETRVGGISLEDKSANYDHCIKKVTLFCDFGRTACVGVGSGALTERRLAELIRSAEPVGASISA